MARKREIINPDMGKRVKIICNENGITQTKLAEAIHLSEKTVSSMVNGHSRVTEATARSIADLFPQKRYCVEWIMGISNAKTQGEVARRLFEFQISARDNISKAVFTLLSIRHYDISRVSIDELRSVYHISRDDEQYNFDDAKMEAFINDVLDYADYLVGRYAACEEVERRIDSILRDRNFIREANPDECVVIFDK
ncbi:MAG: helix-turn-helix transcriptional regulator [Clostridia bacterium]|nr:helix-turn-helix transcriptional regulator [Clostridia bacterium]